LTFIKHAYYIFEKLPQKPYNKHTQVMWLLGTYVTINVTISSTQFLSKTHKTKTVNWLAEPRKHAVKCTNLL